MVRVAKGALQLQKGSVAPACQIGGGLVGSTGGWGSGGLCPDLPNRGRRWLLHIYIYISFEQKRFYRDCTGPFNVKIAQEEDDEEEEKQR